MCHDNRVEVRVHYPLECAIKNHDPLYGNATYELTRVHLDKMDSGYGLPGLMALIAYCAAGSPVLTVSSREIDAALQAVVVWHRREGSLPDP